MFMKIKRENHNVKTLVASLVGLSADVINIFRVGCGIVHVTVVVVRGIAWRLLRPRKN